MRIAARACGIVCWGIAALLLFAVIPGTRPPLKPWITEALTTVGVLLVLIGVAAFVSGGEDI